MPTTPKTPSSTAKSSPFLDTLPPELRLHIYTHLLVAPTPLKGLVARGETKYALHTAILRVNRMIHDEACSVFFGRNVFYLSSLPPLPPPPPPFGISSNVDEGGEVRDDDEEEEDEDEGSGAFEPPLQLSHLPLVRHLHIDLLHHPAQRKPREGHCTANLVCVGAERYVGSVAYVLAAVQKTLLSLRLGADARQYVDTVSRPSSSSSSSSSFSSSTSSSSSTIASHDTARDAQTLLTGFHMADASPRFRAALAGLAVRQVPLRVDFLERCFEFEVEKSALVERGLVDMVGQVLCRRGEIRMRALVAGLQTEKGGRKGVSKMGDLAGCAGMGWWEEVLGRTVRLEGVDK